MPLQPFQMFPDPAIGTDRQIDVHVNGNQRRGEQEMNAA